MYHHNDICLCQSIILIFVQRKNVILQNKWTNKHKYTLRRANILLFIICLLSFYFILQAYTSLSVTIFTIRSCTNRPLFLSLPFSFSSCSNCSLSNTSQQKRFMLLVLGPLLEFWLGLSSFFGYLFTVWWCLLCSY